MKRAALIITDYSRVRVTDDSQYWSDRRDVDASEQLLADLRVLTDYAAGWTVVSADLREAVARVRALLPKEDENA